MHSVNIHPGPLPGRQLAGNHPPPSSAGGATWFEFTPKNALWGAGPLFNQHESETPSRLVFGVEPISAGVGSGLWKIRMGTEKYIDFFSFHSFIHSHSFCGQVVENYSIYPLTPTISQTCLNLPTNDTLSLTYNLSTT